ncbi:MAG TPA: thioredoxin family protein [Gaiellaceae bacterium]|jgi:thioredoxin-like negative regulator of GroEL
MSARAKPQPASDDGAPDTRPKLLFFYTESSGRSRRVEGYLAQVLQRRRNHDTFQIHRIDVETHADLAQRCGVDNHPALVIVENNRVGARIEQPRGCKEIEKALAAWLR